MKSSKNSNSEENSFSISNTFKNKNTKSFLKNFLEKNAPDKKVKNYESLKNKFKEEQNSKQNAINNTLKKKKGKLEDIINNFFKENEKMKKVKLPSQNEAIKILENIKEKEKDKNTRDTIEIIIQIIKNFFANKFDAEKAQKKVIETIKDNKELTSKTLNFLEENPELELLAKKMLGKKFVDCAKKDAVSSVKRENDNISRT